MFVPERPTAGVVPSGSPTVSAPSLRRQLRVGRTAGSRNQRETMEALESRVGGSERPLFFAISAASDAPTNTERDTPNVDPSLVCLYFLFSPPGGWKLCPRYAVHVSHAAVAAPRTKGSLSLYTHQMAVQTPVKVPGIF